MKTLFPLVFSAALLCGCPDSSKLPKVPPQVPEPKAAISPSPDAGHHVPIYFSVRQPYAPASS